VSAEFSAKEISTYRSFVTACLAQTGILFGNSCFEHRGGAGNWREEVSVALGNGEVTQ